MVYDSNVTVHLILESAWFCNVDKSMRGVGSIYSIIVDCFIYVSGRFGTTPRLKSTFLGFLSQIGSIAMKKNHGLLVETKLIGPCQAKGPPILGSWGHVFWLDIGHGILHKDHAMVRSLKSLFSTDALRQFHQY